MIHNNDTVCIKSFTYFCYFHRKGNYEKLQKELENCGYLFISGFHPKHLIQKARKGKYKTSSIISYSNELLIKSIPFLDKTEIHSDP